MTVLAYVWVLAAMLSAGWRLAGQLTYTLDDPYIHLSVAEQILAGGYGINPGEPSSPSSSVLYPLLMAAGLWVGLGDAAPLLVAGLAAAAACAGLAGEVYDALAARGGPPSWPALVALLLPVVLVVNSVGLTLTGMEHTLHVLGVVLVFAGLPRAGGVDAPRLVLGALLCGTVRFEGLALALAALAAAAVAGAPRAAAGALLGLVAALGGYAARMVGWGLPALPSSVLVKSDAAAAAVDAPGFAAVGPLVAQVGASLHNRFGLLFVLLAVGLVAVAVSPGSAGRRRVAAVAAAALGAHVVFGRYGWYDRYEVYAVAIGVVGALRAVDLGGPPAVRALGLAGALAAVAAPYAYTTIESPAAMRAIHEQQHQLHRFATAHFPHPVAVNDIGWVSYRNDTYVLDLWGLGSEAARKATRGGRSPEVIDALTRSAGVRYAMIYPSWFEGAIPPHWCRVATLTTQRVSADSGEVGFYLIDRGAEPEMRAALAGFAAGLPAGAAWVEHPCLAALEAP